MSALGGRNVASKRVNVKEGDEITETLFFIPEKKDVGAGKVDLEGTINLVGGHPTTKTTCRRAFASSTAKSRCYTSRIRRAGNSNSCCGALQGDRIKGVEASFVLVNGDAADRESRPALLAALSRRARRNFRRTTCSSSATSTPLISRGNRKSGSSISSTRAADWS